MTIWTRTTISILCLLTAESCPGHLSRLAKETCILCLKLAFFSFRQIRCILFFMHCTKAVCVGFRICMYLQHNHCVFARLQNELVFTDIIRLTLNGTVSEGPEGAQPHSIGKASPTYRCYHMDTWKNAAFFIFQTSVSNWCQYEVSKLAPSCPSFTASGTSFDFHKQIDYLFLVGTEDGKIHKVGIKITGFGCGSLVVWIPTSHKCLARTEVMSELVKQ